MHGSLFERPVQVARSLFAFAGLPWHPETEAFLDQSTRRQGKAGYLYVLRSSALIAARQWRQTMSPGDQEARLRVMAASPLVQPGGARRSRLRVARLAAR